MPKQEHHKWDKKTYYAGADPDRDPRVIGDINNSEGSYYDAYNFRQGEGENETSLIPIGGEGDFDDRSPDPNFRNIGAFSCNGKLVEFWAHITSASGTIGGAQEPPYITIDGTKVAESFDLGFTADHPLQGDVNESCIGGEVYVTDNNVEPKIFNLKDLEDSLGTPKYFSGYDPSFSSINLPKPADIPVFIGLEELQGSSGLPVGSYRYSMRYVDDQGDRTNWTPFTPLIEVPRRRGSSGDIHPHSRTMGSLPDSNFNTNFSIRIRFRVTNLFDYDSIEIKREAWNSGSGVDFKPQQIIVHRVEVDDQEISVRNFVDQRDSNTNEVVPDDEDVQENTLVQRSKAVRYYNRRLHLMNVQTIDKEVEGVEADDFSPGVEVIPKMEKLGKEGYKSPWNRAYRGRYMSGEKHSFAVTLFDSIGGRSFAKKIVDNYQMPNRRDELSSDSQLYSYNTDGVDAVTTDLNVGKTFEVFDLEDATAKDDLCSFYSVYGDPGGGFSARKAKSRFGGAPGGVEDYCTGQYPSHTDDNPAGVAVTEYRPLTPTPTDGSTEGHRYIINPEVYDGDNWVDYRPEGFGPNYYVQGIAMKGMSGLPNWAQAFSISRSEEAGRVVAQGLGYYSLRDSASGGPVNMLQKDQYNILAHFPDILDGKVSEDVLDDIKDNPGNYKLQFVSPLGFFTEVFNFQERTFEANDRLIDMISYSNVIRDDKGNPKINPGDDWGKSSGSKMYVDYGKWRNPQKNVSLFDSGDKGNNLFTMTQFERVEIVQGGSPSITQPEAFFITLNEKIYNRIHFGGQTSRDYNDDGNKRFHEPWYIVNIVRDNANVDEEEVDGYKETGHYQKIESIIGESDGSSGQSFILVDERWEDCIPALHSSHPLSSENRYVYVEAVNDIKRAWVNVTFKTNSERSSIQNDINNNGFWVAPDGTQVYGMYEHTNNNNKEFSVDFVHGSPDNEARIYVLYDSRIPLSVYGGRAVTYEEVAPIFDVPVIAGGGSLQDKEYNAGFPYHGIRLNPRYYQYNGQSGNQIQKANECKLGSVRQHMALYLCETLSPGHLEYIHRPSDDYFFPAVNYQMKSHRGDTDYFSGYDIDYGSAPYGVTGGFHYKEKRNNDHAIVLGNEYLGAPEIGFETENDFCSLVIWSLPRAINTQDSPGLRTFPALNKYFVSDDQGEIKRAYDQMTDKGRNLFALTERGVVMLLTNKSVLSGINSDEIAYISNENYISDEYWITKEVGCSGEFWRGSAEGKIRIPSQETKQHTELLMWPDRTGVYRLMGTQVDNVMRTGYASKLLPELERAHENDIPLAGVIDEKHNEYWVHIQDYARFHENRGLYQDTQRGARNHFAFNLSTNKWIGHFVYNYHDYLFHNGEVIGLRDAMAKVLDKGFTLPFGNIVASVEQISSGSADQEHEFIRIRVNTDHLRGTNRGKPESVIFMDGDGGTMCEVSQTQQGQLYMKRYDGWEAFIPRKQSSYDPDRKRVQEDYVLYRIRFANLEDLVLRSTNVQLKPLK